MNFDYDYTMQPSPLSQSQTSVQQWNGNRSGQDRQAMDIYTNPSQEPTLYGNAFGFGTTIDGSYSTYEMASDMTLAGLSITPPGSSFAVTGLPFCGLEYIRNYSSTGFNPTGEDSLWRSYDPVAFGLEPDIPFTIAEPGSEMQDPLHQ
jgi:hypothetical protein